MFEVLPTVTAQPVTPIHLASDPPVTLATVARHLLTHLECGRRIDATIILRANMETAFCASDASGAWTWKLAYDACEAATVLFLRKYGGALFRKAGSPAAALLMLATIADLFPTHTCRPQECEAFQQFSTPIALGLAAVTAVAILPADRVLEPSAGTGLLAILAEIAGASLVLNELAKTRADLLAQLFPAIPITHFDAAQIDDHLDPAIIPSVVLMDPPFSILAHVAGRGGERTVGRRVSAAWTAGALSSNPPSLPPDDAFAALIDGKSILDPADGLQLRRVGVMGAYRIELSGFTDTMRERLTADGLFHGIIAWALRVFVPIHAGGPVILARVLDRYPVPRICAWEAA